MSRRFSQFANLKIIIKLRLLAIEAQRKTESNITFAVENGSPNSKMPENGLPMKRLIFVQHALDRMDERGITKELVIDILNHAESIDSNDEKRKVAQRFIDGKLLRVIYEDETDAIIVITVYKTSKISKYI